MSQLLTMWVSGAWLTDITTKQLERCASTLFFILTIIISNKIGLALHLASVQTGLSWLHHVSYNRMLWGTWHDQLHHVPVYLVGVASFTVVDVIFWGYTTMNFQFPFPILSLLLSISYSMYHILTCKYNFIISTTSPQVWLSCTNWKNNRRTDAILNENQARSQV